MRIYDAKEVPDGYKIAFYDALAAHFACTIDRYYTEPGQPADPRYDSGVEPSERTEVVLMEVGNEDSGIGDLFVVMEVENWVDFLGFRVELPTLTRDAFEWEGGGPEIAGKCPGCGMAYHARNQNTLCRFYEP
jgi:hypothetical protein